MKDIYAELVVPKASGIGLHILKVLFLALAILSFAMTFLFGIYALIAVALFAALYFFTLQKIDCEYEYIHTNQYFDVELIIRKQKRKQLVSIELSKVILLAPVGHTELRPFSNSVKIDYSGKQDSVYAMVCGTGSSQKVFLLSLNGQMLQSLKKWMPAKVRCAE